MKEKEINSKYAFPAIFEEAYLPNFQYKKDTVTLALYSKSIGKIKIKSGKIIACDPAYVFDYMPFEQVFPKGDFEVQLSIVKTDDIERIAFSRIVFSSNSVNKWELAVLKGQEKIPLKSGKFHGYGVDSGTGLYMDQDGVKSLIEMDDYYQKVFIDSLEKTYRPVRDYVLYNFGNYNLAAFSTGFGDGTYATYIGYDSNGKICRLLTDFNLVPWWE